MKPRRLPRPLRPVLRAFFTPLHPLVALRLRHGLTWRRNHPAPTLYGVFLACLCIATACALLALWAVLRENDALLLDRVETEKGYKALLGCLNGKPLGSFPTPRPRQGAYGQTVVMCDVWELPV